MATAKTIDLTGRVVREIELPDVFDVDYRPDLIKKAVLAAQANRLQPYGPRLYAGMDTSARSWGSGRGVAQIPRLINSSRAARVPHARGGRRAHPPKPEADRSEKVNTKERRYAIRSAIAATRDPTLVSLRGHIFEAELPIVTENALENLEKTKQVIEVPAGYRSLRRCSQGKIRKAYQGRSWKAQRQEIQAQKEHPDCCRGRCPYPEGCKKPVRSRCRNSEFTECRTACTGYSCRTPYYLDRICN